MNRLFTAIIVFIIWSLIGMYWYYNCSFCKTEEQNQTPIVVKDSIPKPEIKKVIPKVVKLSPLSQLIIKKNNDTVFEFEKPFSIYKDSSSIHIPESLAPVKDSIYKHLNQFQNIELVITSNYHPSEISQDSLNQNIGQLRGLFLKNQLIEIGVNPDRIVINDTIRDFDFLNKEFTGAIQLYFNELSSERISEINKGITNKTLYTSFNSRKFKADNTLQAYAAELKNYLISYPNKIVTITGHTDNTGDEKANFVIGRDRATNVMKYLISQGINKEQLIAKSEGETNPVAPNDSEENRSKNRRIEISIN